jgi:hypothetical protein
MEAKLGSEVYYIYPGPLSWEAAEAKCSSKGMHLASIGTLYQTDQLTAAFRTALPAATHFWIGLNDRAREAGSDYVSANWAWADGGYFFYTNWDKSTREPTGGAVEDCVKLSASTGWWYDDDCSKALPFVCRSECHRGWSSMLLTAASALRCSRIILRPLALCS